MDRVRMYCDAESHPDPQQYAKRMLRRKQKGYTYFKMDLTQSFLQGKPDTLIGSSPTDKGLAEWRKYIIAIREVIGWDVPLGADHTGNLTVNDAIRLGNAIEDLQLAFLEDIILDWHKTAALKKVTDTINVRTLHGENAFGLEGFKRWFVDPRSVNMIHPDMATSGGILETHLIGMEADRNDMPIFFHHAGSPVGSIASVHCACTLPNFVAMENHAVDIPWWDDLVTGLPNPIIQEGYITVPEKPGLGLDFNKEVIREHLSIPVILSRPPSTIIPRLATARVVRTRILIPMGTGRMKDERKDGRLWDYKKCI